MTKHLQEREQNRAHTRLVRAKIRLSAVSIPGDMHQMELAASSITSGEIDRLGRSNFCHLALNFDIVLAVDTPGYRDLCGLL